jgi:flagellar basal-body rod protein FlgB
MTLPILASSNVVLLEQVVNFTQARHGVLAGNIANIDTPEYKTRDLSPHRFQESLKEAMETRRQQPPPPYLSPGITGNLLTAPRQFASTTIGTPPYDDMREVKDSIKHILYHDGHDVSLESQVTELAKNQSMHNMAISLLSVQFRQLGSAISERVG